MLVVIAAMQKEADALINLSTIKKSYSLGGKKIYQASAFNKDFYLIVCGIGKVNAAMATQLAIDKLGADKLLNIGVAGGILSDMKIGQIYSIDKAVQYDFDLCQVNGTQIGTLDEYSTPYLLCNAISAFPVTTLATGDRFNDNTQDLSILAQLNAGIRDMEGGAIAQVALTNKIPLYMVKCISDVVGSDCVQQYKDNLVRALGNLSNAMQKIFLEI